MTANEAAFVAAIKPREFDDGFLSKPGDFGGPFGCFAFEMCSQVVGAVRVLAQIIPIGETFGEQHMHHRASERAVRAWLHWNMQIGLCRGRRAIGIDHDQLRAALFRRHRVMHDVDLRMHGIAAPNDDNIRMLGGFAQIHAAFRTDARNPA